MAGKKEQAYSYTKEVVAADQECAKTSAEILASTYANSEYIKVIRGGKGGLVALNFPAKKLGIAHSASGDPRETDPVEHAKSLLDILNRHSCAVDAHPIAFTNIMDLNSGKDLALPISMARGLEQKAKEYHVACINGETAILGSRVNPEAKANVSGTMISSISKAQLGRVLRTFPVTRIYRTSSTNFSFEYQGVKYSVFDPKDRPVTANCDGTGTKPEIRERVGQQLYLSVDDMVAMLVDDTIKNEAEVLALSGIYETSGRFSMREISSIENYGTGMGAKMGFLLTLQREKIGKRLVGYKPGAHAANFNGTSISALDIDKIGNQPKPYLYDVLIAISAAEQDKRGGRSNGFTLKRKIPVKMYGNEWHTTPGGQELLGHLLIPSIIFYPLIRHLRKEGLITSMYHMSGGAYKDKLAEPLARHGYFVEIGSACTRGLFTPHKAEITLFENSGMTLRDAYTSWPFGNEGFVTADINDMDNVLTIIHAHGYAGRAVGIIEKHNSKTGVELTAFNGKKVSFVNMIR